MIEIIILIFSITYIVDVSGFVTQVSKFLYEFSTNKIWLGKLIPKPFSCGMCLSIWVVFFYSLFVYGFIYSLGIAAAAGIISVLFKQLIKLILKLINRIE